MSIRPKDSYSSAHTRSISAATAVMSSIDLQLAVHVRSTCKWLCMFDRPACGCAGSIDLLVAVQAKQVAETPGSSARKGNRPEAKKKALAPGSKDGERRPLVLGLHAPSGPLGSAPLRRDEERVASRKRVSDVVASSKRVSDVVASWKTVTMKQRVCESTDVEEPASDPIVLFSRCSSLKIKLPPLESMRARNSFIEASRQGTKFIESIYGLTADYEIKARRDRELIMESMREVDSLEKKLKDKNDSDGGEAAELLKREYEEAVEALEVREERLQRENEKLKKDLTARVEIELRFERREARMEKNIKESCGRDIKRVRSELSAKLDKVTLALRDLQDARRAEAHVTQIDANLDFIRLHKKGEITDFDAEVEMLRKIRAEKMGVLVKCDEIASRLLSELGIPPLTPDPPIVPPPAFDPESVEKAAGKIGVADPHGSNITAPESSDDTSLGVEQVSGETTVVGDGAGEPTPEKTTDATSTYVLLLFFSYLVPGWLYPL
ncbi:unnamed protein product [Microthlaspi erraticum]|uniref:Uncharacterized protein n=1 Tax=Microthlaspi erraticum TaxID=1685480 RepID=A0A6D2JQ98_9BRAS|nr:unnamed protein product [Microthlaspi erraticum]CAA7053694.1 unnamed protein product [Microthlaspi erraticum]